jgi:hypothetical protein
MGTRQGCPTPTQREAHFVPTVIGRLFNRRPRLSCGMGEALGLSTSGNAFPRFLATQSITQGRRTEKENWKILLSFNGAPAAPNNRLRPSMASTLRYLSTCATRSLLRRRQEPFRDGTVASQSKPISLGVPLRSGAFRTLFIASLQSHSARSHRSLLVSSGAPTGNKQEPLSKPATSQSKIGQRDKNQPARSSAVLA